jgi:hypothetical protein
LRPGADGGEADAPASEVVRDGARGLSKLTPGATVSVMQKLHIGAFLAAAPPVATSRFPRGVQQSATIFASRRLFRF